MSDPFAKLPRCSVCDNEMGWDTTHTLVQVYDSHCRAWLQYVLCRDCERELWVWMKSKGMPVPNPDPIPPLCIQQEVVDANILKTR